MNKVELASYLVNLHTLLSAQTSNVSNPSAVLGAEYERVWAQLKEEITNETRTKHEQGRGSETGTDHPRSEHFERR